MKMPEKNPDIWTVIWLYLADFFNNHNRTLCGAMAAVILSLTRSFLYGKEQDRMRKFIEAFMCGVIAVTLRPVLVYFNLGEDLIMAVGAGIGLLGIDPIRRVMLKFVTRKAVGENTNENQ